MSSKTNETAHETETEITHATLSSVFACVNFALAKKDKEILRLKAELAKIKACEKRFEEDFKKISTNG